MPKASRKPFLKVKPIQPQSTDYFSSIICLKSYNQCQQAQDRLMTMAKQVEPILKNRSWKVKNLKEFYPKNHNLLGTNYGKTITISIRLRSSHNKEEFLPYEECMGTLLHELSHIVHSDHNKGFYDLLNQLKDEFMSLIYNQTKIGTLHPNLETIPVNSFVPFSGKGVRLGGNDSEGSLKWRVYFAAQSRQNSNEICCTQMNETPSAIEESESNSHISDTESDDDIKIISVVKKASTHITIAEEWECNKCTFKNVSIVLQCKICNNIKSIDQTQFQTHWNCKSCTFLNPIQSTTCEICQLPF